MSLDYKTRKQWNITQQYPNWVMTINYGAEGQLDKEMVQQGLATLCEKAEYWCYGWEKAPTTGQLHVQAYVQLEKKERLSAIKKWSPFLSTAHLEPARGDEVQNKEYCMKEGDFHESESEPRKINPGKREKVRWAETAELAKKGRFMETEPQMQLLFLNHMMKLHNYCKPAPEPLHHSWRAEWLWGPPGTGKSLTARREIATAKTGGVYMKLLNKWWCNWQTDQGVIMEDVDPETAKHLGNHMKIWCDIYPFTAEVKGTAGTIRPDTLKITSNYHPFELFGHDEKLFKAMMRRLRLRYFPKNGENPPDFPGEDEIVQAGGTMVFSPPASIASVPDTPSSKNRPHFPITREIIDVSDEPDPDRDEAEEQIEAEEEDF